jgi:hypothetical protein
MEAVGSPELSVSTLKSHRCENLNPTYEAPHYVPFSSILLLYLPGPTIPLYNTYLNTFSIKLVFDLVP